MAMGSWTLRFASFVALVMAAAAPPIAATPCPDCFAVFVMPDTQNYTVGPVGETIPRNQHLNLMMDWICAANAAGGFVEPDPVTGAPGKQMPIVMVIQLGDLVLGQVGWPKISSAFERLDACNVPYVVTTGNHDYKPNIYHADTGFDQFFPPSRTFWASHTCAKPSACIWEPWITSPQEWFIAEPESLNPSDPLGYGPNRITANARNHLLLPNAGTGPRQTEPGRHRAALIRLPNSQRMLFLGLEMGFDNGTLPPNDDDTAFPKRVLQDYAGIPAVVFHHYLIDGDGNFAQVSAFGSDTYQNDTEEWWNELFNQPGQERSSLLLGFNGHFDPNPGTTKPLKKQPMIGSETVNLFMRNYMFTESFDSNGTSCGAAYGDGWNVIAVFDPGAQEIRIREYQIEDLDDDCTHDGTPDLSFNPMTGPPEIRRTDLLKPPETISYDFPDARPASYDNCSADLHDNPSQYDSDCDGIGNYCDCDFNEDGACGIADVNLFLPDFQLGVEQNHIGTDMDADGMVGIHDFNLFLDGFSIGVPGPAGPDVVPPQWSWCMSSAMSSGGGGAGAMALQSSAPIVPLADTPENAPLIQFLREHDPTSPYLADASRTAQ